ncbi:PREDICTED: putative F-box/kelch-repeat protein At3g16880 [Camelina sativa]|uniref:F-box/kelch-repeat protein At3g16880 n=1 Tax=Camelina sativa TaxID=90675 RepID=A0ABM0T2M8_CAMSA|nr:PREDICTED: putative F-box/kelch-repeat protein At3g16880 [Camelina sativa]
MDIWITTKIEPNAVSWSYFLKLDRTVIGIQPSLSFFIDEKKKIAVIYFKDSKESYNFTAYMCGEDGYCYQEVHHGESESASRPFVYTYAPSWVQIHEKFGPRLPLPSHYVVGLTALYSVREEHLALLNMPWNTSEMKIWVTTKIGPSAVSWSYFLEVDISDFKLNVLPGCFFIDQENKLVVLNYLNNSKCLVAYITGEDVYLRKVDLGFALKLKDLPYSPTHHYLNSAVLIEVSLLDVKCLRAVGEILLI